MSSEIKRPSVLAIASKGGHWVQLLRLRPAWDGCVVSYVSTDGGYQGEVLRDAQERAQPEPAFYSVPDANRWSKLALLRQFFAVIRILLAVRPDVIVTTGASPGFFAIFLGRFIGARTIWIDSIANADELSLSGQKAGRFASLWLTQWEHLAKPNGPFHQGGVL